MNHSDQTISQVASWLGNTLGLASRPRFVDSLPGSTTASLLVFEATGPGGSTVPFVVKRYDRSLPDVEGAECVQREAFGLLLAQTADLPAPKLVAIDEFGEETGWPTVAMTRLAGRPVLAGTSPWWLEGLASTLRQILSADLDGMVASLPEVGRWRDLDAEQPEWVPDSGLWRAAIEAARDLPMSANTLLHRDFHPLNVLWHNQAVSGVVDWIHVCQGPAEFDISRCRVNIAVTADLAAADHFLQSCGDLATAYTRAWDLETVLGFTHHPDVLLTLNAYGAALTPASIRSVLIELIAAAVE